jgi:AraC family transcriptional regulator, regulatory protein of adaptative response / methylated-DNA-[protein]-cysteine methyltransferase
MKSNRDNTLCEVPIETREGRFMAHYSMQGLAALCFPESATAVSRKAQEVPAQIEQWHRLTSKALMQVLDGGKPAELPPMDLSAGTPFQREVWYALRRIGPGETRSYGEVAQAIGRPKALRAVGGACGANPIPVLIPCHRVLAANSRIGGFSGGLDWKRKLLANEGARVSG